MEDSKYNKHIRIYNDDIDTVSSLSGNSVNFVYIVILKLLLHMFVFMLDAERDRVK